MATSKGSSFRRLLLVFAVAVAVIANILVILYRVKQDANDSATSTRLASNEFGQPLENSLPDVSTLAEKFEANLSFAPLRNRVNEIEKIIYDLDTSTVNQFVNANGTIVGLNRPATRQRAGVMNAKPQHFIRELIFSDGSPDDSIKYVEHTFSNDEQVNKNLLAISRLVGLFGGMSSERVLSVSGKYANTKIGFHLISDIDPLWQSSPVRLGSRWTQRIAVEPELNPNGQIVAELEVISTFVRDGQHFARIHRQYGFNAYRPTVSLVALVTPPESKEKKDTLRYRIDELFDINVDTGIIHDRSNVSQIWFEGTEHENVKPNIPGILVTTRAIEKLNRVVFRN